MAGAPRFPHRNSSAAPLWCSRRLRAPPLTRLERIAHTHTLTHSVSFVLGQRHAKYDILNVKLNPRFTFQFSRCPCCESAGPPPLHHPSVKLPPSSVSKENLLSTHTHTRTHTLLPAAAPRWLSHPSLSQLISNSTQTAAGFFTLRPLLPAGRRCPCLPPDLASSLAHATLAVTLQDLTRSVARSSLKQEAMQEPVPQEEEETSEATASPPGRC